MYTTYHWCRTILITWFSIMWLFHSIRRPWCTKNKVWILNINLLTTIENTLCQSSQCYLPPIDVTPTTSTARMSAATVHMIQPLLTAAGYVIENYQTSSKWGVIPIDLKGTNSIIYCPYGINCKGWTWSNSHWQKWGSLMSTLTFSLELGSFPEYHTNGGYWL